MSKMDFIDVELRGNPFTWTNNRKGSDLIQVRLDRLMVTQNWNQLGNSLLENLTRTASDHSPLIFQWEDGLKGGPKPFRYEIMWQSHLEFKDRIQEWWSRRLDEIAMYRLT